MSNSDPSTTSIIKSDCAGRTRYSRQYKQEVLAAFETSSLSAPQFAAQCGLKYPTFASWLAAAKRQHRDTSPAQNRPTFLIAELASAVEMQHGGLEVCLPGGAVARITSRDQLPLVVELLRQLS
jgi:hypothetical protein